MSSQFDQACFEKDPENKLYWRREPKRLEAEAIRDAILAASGHLDLEPPGASLVAKAGPSVVRDGRLVSSTPGQPVGPSPLRSDRQRRMMAAAGLDPGGLGSSGMGPSGMRPTLQTLDQPATFRSVYLPIVRENIPRTLDVFDFAEASMVIGQRETSNTPDQGLYFLNNQFVIQQSDEMARRLQEHSDDLREQVKHAFVLTYSRQPNHRELNAVLDFYRGFQVETAIATRDRRRRGTVNDSEISLKKLSAVCQSLMAAAEFRYLD